MTLKLKYRYPSREARRAWANTAGFRETEDGQAFVCPQCFAIPYRDLPRALIHQLYKHAAPEDADDLLEPDPE